LLEKQAKQVLLGNSMGEHSKENFENQKLNEKQNLRFEELRGKEDLQENEYLEMIMLNRKIIKKPRPIEKVFKEDTINIFDSAKQPPIGGKSKICNLTSAKKST